MKHWGMLAAGMLLALAAPAAAREIKIGDRAPDFELTLIDKTKVTLADLKGQVIVLNFWATWCGPCRTELPLLDVYYAVQAPHGMRAFAIATEDSLPLNRLKPLFAKLHIPSARSIKGSYAIKGGLPTNYVIDRAGVVRYARAGAFTLDILNEVVVPLLNEPAPAG